MRLADCIRSRDNNLNLIRIVAALAVLVGHSFALLAQPEPWGQRWGVTPGSVAVDMFFIVSGMLVCGSLVGKQSVIDYVCARALRIFPALIVMLVLTVFVLGPYFTELPLVSYFSAPETVSYFVRCATLISGVNYYLPGVFAHNLYPRAVNGSLWTMPFEVKMYLILLIFWVGLAIVKSRRVEILKFLIVGLTLVAGALVFDRHFQYGETSQFQRLFFMFFSGASMYMLKGKLVLKSFSLYLLLPLVVVSGFISKDLFFILYHLSIAYLVVCLAYIPSGWIRKYNALGDYSYGVYIYAFPVQQAVAALLPQIMIWQMILVSGAATLLLAVLSWYVIEKPALRLKGAAVDFLRAAMGRLRLSDNAGN